MLQGAAAAVIFKMNRDIVQQSRTALHCICWQPPEASIDDTSKAWSLEVVKVRQFEAVQEGNTHAAQKQTSQPAGFEN